MSGKQTGSTFCWSSTIYLNLQLAVCPKPDAVGQIWWPPKPSSATWMMLMGWDMIQNRRWPFAKKIHFSRAGCARSDKLVFSQLMLWGVRKNLLLHWKIGWGACPVSTGGEANKNATIFETTPTPLISLKQHTSDAPWGKATNPECLVVQGLFNFDLLLTQANAGVEIRGK